MKKIRTNLNLDKWRTYIIMFLPIVTLVIIYKLPSFNQLRYGSKFVIETCCQIFTITFLYGLQFSLGRNFYKRIKKKAYFFNINGLIPLIFWIFVCVWWIYHLPSYLKMGPSTNNSHDDNLQKLWIYSFLIHYSITYFFINKYLVKYELKRQQNLAYKKLLKDKFYKPMNRIINISWIILLGVFIYVAIYVALTKNL